MNSCNSNLQPVTEASLSEYPSDSGAGGNTYAHPGEHADAVATLAGLVAALDPEDCKPSEATLEELLN